MRETIATLDTGHGNPATLLALLRIFTQSGVEPTDIFLKNSGALAQVPHTLMTTLAPEAYTKHSSELRRSILGQCLSFLCNKELIREVDKQHPFMSNLYAIQEFMLLGAKPKDLEHRFNSVSLVVPDVYPKPSAVEEFKNKLDLDVRFIVWNVPAYVELFKVFGKRARLFAPFLVEGLANMKNSEEQDVWNVVIKSSGSGGMNKDTAMRIVDSCCKANLRAFAHMPGGYVSTVHGHHEYDPVVDKTSRIKHFYGKISKHTRVVISYPSEMTQVAAELMQNNIPAKMVAFPPRGVHEARNLQFAIDAGICVAILSNHCKDTNQWGVPIVTPATLHTVLGEDVSDATLHHVQSLLGDRPIREVISE